MSAVDAVEAEVREMVRRRGLDPIADRAAMRRLVDEVVTHFDERALNSSLGPLTDESQAARTAESVRTDRSMADGGSAALRALGGADRVNSIHHQAVRTPGDGLVVSARSPDGVVEAVEGDDVLGVQWHPERLVATDPRHLAAFRWLVGARVLA